MKLVKENINEKFKEQSDPIKSMGIGRPDYSVALFDWNTTPENMAKQFANALKHFGITVTLDPLSEGGDMYVYILSDRKLTPRQLKQVAKEIHMEEDDEDEQ
jgi:hypothetical protein